MPTPAQFNRLAFESINCSREFGKAIFGGKVAILSVEDLIADRVGQFASGTARDRIDQARTLFQLHSTLDRVYLERRIREETMGDYGVEALEN